VSSVFEPVKMLWNLRALVSSSVLQPT